MDLSRGTSIALAVSALLAASGCGSASDEAASSASQSIKCEGGNACQGLSECATQDGKSSCVGENACKGHGLRLHPNAGTVRSTADPQQALSEPPSAQPGSGLARVGFGLRVPHYDSILSHGLRADFAEAISENFLGRGGRAFSVLERVRSDMPVALHGVSLSIGGIDPLRDTYLTELTELATRIAAFSVSDHLCFGTFGGHYAHDLWPLPYTEEAHFARRGARAEGARPPGPAAAARKRLELRGVPRKHARRSGSF